MLSNDDDLNELTDSGDNDTTAFDKERGYVMFCLQPAVRWNISIFNLETDTNLSEAIFRSICKGKSIDWLILVLFASLVL